jgi:hypothetical protein
MKLKLLTALPLLFPLVIQSMLVQAPFTLYGKTFLSPRSPSTNIVWEVVGVHPFIDHSNTNKIYGMFAATPAYTQTFKPDRLAEYFFSTNRLTITGSQVPVRGNNDLLADYFGLAPTFVSTVFLKPSIQNVILNLDAYIGYRSWFFRIYAPLVWARWDFKLEETVDVSGLGDEFPAFYMNTDAVNPGAFSFAQAMQGNATFGDQHDGIQFGKIDGPKTKTRLSEIHTILGWNFVENDRGFVGLNLRAAIPTGNRSQAIYLFEPMVGNGHHAEFGIGINSRTELWEQDGIQALNIFLNANLMHLFKSRQKRSFDFTCNGFGSRYMLIKEFDATGNYSGNITSAINKTTLDCHVHVNVQLDGLIMFAYNYKRLTFDIGYNGWIRSHERLEISDCELNNAIPLNTYAFKGIQNVATVSGVSNATQSTAMLNGNYFTDQAAVVDPNSPVFITSSDLNLHSAAASRGLTNKLFANLSYAFNKENYKFAAPFIGLGFEVEFEGVHRKNDPNKNSISQWGIWAQGGCYF